IVCYGSAAMGVCRRDGGPGDDGAEMRIAANLLLIPCRSSKRVFCRQLSVVAASCSCPADSLQMQVSRCRSTPLRARHNGGYPGPCWFLKQSEPATAGKSGYPEQRTQNGYI